MNNKDTIYIDIDDEITSIIEKVRASDNKIVALVLPKRAAVLQSVVNMKLLKRSADDIKKQIVLITSEAGLLPLAGSIGLYVASTLQSKPAVPTQDTLPDEIEDDDAVDLSDEEFDPKVAADKPVGDLATPVSVAPAGKVIEAAETIDMADEPDVPAAAAQPAKKVNGKKTKQDKKLAVPNFNRFRKRIILAVVALIVVIGLGYVCLAVLPTAAITATTDTSTINTNQTLALSTQQQSVDVDGGVLPAETKQLQKTSTQQATATGSKNAGEKAHGNVTLINCSDSPVTIYAGAGVSANGNTYITQQTLKLDSGNYGSNGKCKTSGSHVGSVNVIAQSGGSNYNIDSGVTMTIAPAPDGSYSSSSIQASSNGSIAGGTDNNIKVVAQSDIDGAKQKLSGGDTNAAKQQLQQQLQTDGYQFIDATFVPGQPSISTSANAGDQADNVTVTQTITYTVFGVKKADLETYIKAMVDKQIDTSKQQIQDDGLSKATFKLNGTPSDQVAQVGIQVSSIAGPKLDIPTLKTQLAGKKSGDVKSTLKSTPGVEDVTVKFSPFWVTKVPSKADKVTITLQASGSGSGQ